MTTTFDRLESALKGNVVINKHCYPEDIYETLCHTLFLYIKGNLEGKCRIGGSNRILPVVTWLVSKPLCVLTCCRIQFDR